ncbi:MAG: threo-3-hydroxy-L-aspartate ammonia-lyase [Desulfobacterales bacterium]|jgi:threonine dehydratase
MELFDLVIEAKKRLEGHAHVTPVMTSQTLNEITKAQIFFKCENFQRMGAFKFRGAYNAMSQLTEEQKKGGVITYSSGNHAQAVALVGRLLQIRTVVVMPNNAPVIKREATRAYGATVVEYDPEEATREAICRNLETRYGHTLIPPYDHINIVAGQGTTAMELIDAVETLDMLLVPCGGGGLLSGCAVAAKGLDPNCRVVGIEPELADDATRSFHTGRLHTIKNPPTIADGTRTPSLGEITFPLVLEHVDDMQTVSEKAIMDAVKFLFFRMKLVAEPSGVLGLAALLGGAFKPQGRIGIILSGGNIDGLTMKKILGS